MHEQGRRGSSSGGAGESSGGGAGGGTSGSPPEATRERWVEAPDGVRLRVAEAGDPASPTVLLVHGYPDSKEVWWPVATRLQDAGLHVVLYDVRGCGKSDAPAPLRGGFTLEKLTDDFLAVADAVSPDAPVHLVGHDWGSVQGWEFATLARTEGRIATFTSLSGPSLDHLGHWIARRTSRPTPRHLAQLLRQGAKSWYIAALRVPGLPELAWRGPLGRHWPTLVRRIEGTPDDGYPTASLPEDAAHGAWLYRDNVRARLARPRTDPYAHAPVLLVTPLNDAFLLPALSEGLEQWVPRLTRRSLPAKHWVPRTRPTLLASWIADFVRAHEPTATDGEPAERGVLATGPRAERFGGRLVVVTGAAGGIGRAVALAFAAAGARVVAVDRDPAGAARTAALARSRGAARARAEAVDVTDAGAMERLAERVAANDGVPDVLVNNAGVGLAGPFLETTTEDWQRVLDVNLWGVIHGCRLFGRQMADRGEGGHVVNIASAAAFQPSLALPAYSTSKAAVLMLSECLRAEFAGHRVGVSAVCPGPVNTRITSTARFVGVDAATEQRQRHRVARLYRLRNSRPERAADSVLRAVVQNRAVVTVTPEARAVRVLGRWAPGPLRARLARIRPPLGQGAGPGTRGRRAP